MNDKQKILVVGFGVEGKILTNYFLSDCEVTVADRKNIEEFDSKIVDEYTKQGVRWQTGDRYLDGLENFDLIAHSPAITADVREKIYASGVQTTTQTQIFLDKVKTNNTIGVTGTNGKGTTCTLIYEILKAAGKRVFLVGNIGEGMLNHLDEINENDWVVMELSSYQLRDITKSPHIGVVLNITPDHMNIHVDMDEYIDSKANLIRYQELNDIAVLNGDYEVTKQIAEYAKGEVIMFHKADIEDKYSLKIPGKHNFENAAAALAVCKVASIENSVVRNVFETFDGLEHRLQIVANKNGIKYVDDSISTNPATVLAAIKAFPDPKILILGGSDKKAEFQRMSAEITADKTIKAIILTGATADILEQNLKGAGFDRPVIKAVRMNDIIDGARHLAVTGDTVLLSPGCASFGEYIDYKDRGEQFKKVVLSKN
jgi:UDP-N-acetylmuramoylalanine--D-glutamate ligase